MAEILVIGGGFFGMYLADHFANIQGHNVRLIEKETQFMSRASYANQARVHNGYHYPRSVLTALRSRISFPLFVNEFKECIDSEFDKYYLIAKPLGKVTAHQFLKFCERIGAHCEPASGKIKSLTNPSLIEACFSVVEYAFDAVKLRDLMIDRIHTSTVNALLNVSAESVVQYDHVFNCTYSDINYVNANSGLSLIPLKHEMTEMCLVEMPGPLKSIGITVMCGPFFSVMPFPSLGIHSFSHVRYTPHYELKISEISGYDNANSGYLSAQRNSAWRYMQKDATRYIPLLEECHYLSSLWEVKTVLPRSETDDSRPILFLPHYKFKGFHCIMGGKIDNVYDAIEAINAQHLIN